MPNTPLLILLSLASAGYLFAEEAPSSKIPDAQRRVADFVVTLPGGAEVNRNGLTPDSPDYVKLSQPFRLPVSDILLESGTVFERVDGEGWAKLKISGPNGTVLAYTAKDFCGCNLSPIENWTIDPIPITPLSSAAQQLLDNLNEDDNIDTFLKSMASTPGLTDLEARRALVEYAGKHPTNISSDDIKTLYTDLRNRLESIKYTSATLYTSKAGKLKEFNRPSKVLSEFRMQGNMLYFETVTFNPDAETGILNRYIYNNIHEGHFISDNGLMRGSRHEFAGRERYYGDDHIFGASMLLSSSRDLASNYTLAYSIPNQDFYVLAIPVNRLGTKVIPCITLNFRVFCLDPSKGYALVTDENTYFFDESVNMLVEYPQKFSTHVTSHQKTGDEFWLPTEVINVWEDRGEEILRRHTHYSGIVVNHELPHSDFEDRYPDGVLVIDFTSGHATTISGSEYGSLPTPKPNPGNLWKWVWILNAIALLGILTLAIFRRQA